jgi:NAD(P)-dependent dehydrogenase (short-subunit alcohol dehydrogenase family)
MILKGKTALVTGASEGIGLEIAKQLVKAGTDVIGVSRNIESKGIKDFTVKNCDVSNADEVKKLFAWIGETHDSLGAIVNNAGVWQKLAHVEDIPDTEIEGVLNTNLKGPILVTKYALPLLKKSDESMIVNISSKSGVEAKAEQSVYVATKFGMRGFTEVIREDLRETSVRVLGVYQGGINTQMFAKAGDKDVPVKDFTEPNDLAEQIVLAMSTPQKLNIQEIRIGHNR